MHIDLWERNAYSAFVKSFIHAFVHAEEYVPVVLCLHPNPCCQIHGAVGQLSKSDKGLWVLQDSLIRKRSPS